MKTKLKKYKTLLLFLCFATGLTLILVYTNKKDTTPSVAKELFSYKELDSLLNANPATVEIKIQALQKTLKGSTRSEDFAYYYFYKLKVDLKRQQLDSVPLYITKSIQNAEIIHDTPLIFQINKTAGKFYLQSSDYVKSLEHFTTAMNLIHDQPKSENMADIYIGMAGVYFYLEDLDQTIHYSNLAHDIYVARDIKKGQASFYNNMANVSYIKRDENLTIDYLQKSIKLSEEIKDTTTIISNLNTLSIVELNKKKYTQAIDYLDKAYPLALTIESLDLQAAILCNYGLTYEALNEYDKSIAYFDRARKIGTTDSLRTKMIILRSLARISENRGDFQKSNDYLKEFYQLIDQVKGTSVTQKTEKIRWENLLKEQAYKQEIIEQNLKFKIYIYSFISLLTIVLAVLIWYMYKNKSKTLRISQLENKNLEEKVEIEKELKRIQVTLHANELEFLHKELTALNIQMLTKNNFVSEMKEIITTKNDPQSSDKVLRQLEHSINRMTNVDKDWGQFQKVFQKVHPDFFNHIQINFPQVSKSELRICAYIKINMANTEMASLLNISHKSLITSRYRIRKKLNLDSTQDLDKYIQSL